MVPSMHNAQSVPFLTTLQNASRLFVVMQSVFPKTFE